MTDLFLLIETGFIVIKEATQIHVCTLCTIEVRKGGQA